MNRLIKNLAIAGALSMSSIASAVITPFSDDFEGYTATDINALGNAGYLIFGFVETHSDPVNHTGTICTSSGTTPPGGDYGYGTFPAPNDPASPAFSTITTTEAGPNQGVQGISIFADYNNGDHAALCNMQHNVFREQTIDASNVGETWVFRFDYKSSLAAGISPSTAAAFIKTIDPGAGFAQTNLVTHDTTGAPDTWTEVIEISLFIDAGLVGQLIQFGFSGTATNFDPSAIFYDNIVWFSAAPVMDTDGDTIDDSVDNCTNVANTAQVDTDGDGHGNACDGDFQNNCLTNIFDTFAFKANFAGTDQLYDINSTGGPVQVNIFDLFAYKGLFGSPPGPSACGACPCP